VTRINIAVTGGPCTGKSTLAAALFAYLKGAGLDYDLITEESRKLKKELRRCRSPFDRFYLWIQQEREEKRSSAADGFITDTALYQFYIQARQHAKGERDELAVRELFRMCLDLERKRRYQIIVMAKDPFEIPYKMDQARTGGEERARERHMLLKSFLEHQCPKKLLFVSGSTDERLKAVLTKLEEIRPTV
jgi:nicotinamide riboside kinase